jgi:hypothetical protein
VQQQNHFAHETFATVFGIIYELHKNPLPGATITAENLDSGYEYQTISYDDGRYIISRIQPGQYRMKVEISGFIAEEKQKITFNIGSKLKIDFYLELEKIEEQVIVTAAVPLIEITKSEISSIVGRDEIENLPLKGRDYTELIKLQPGVQEVTANGQSWASDEILLDGVSNTRNMEKDARSNIPADAIQEFRVLVNQYAAEYGNASGSLTNTITRSGSNEFRGRLSLFWRSEAFDAKNYFAQDEDKAELDDWRYGGFLGGPLKKDSTHFFLAYEGQHMKTYRLVTSPLVLQESVPSQKTNNQLLLKINHNLSGKNILNFRFTYDDPLTTNYNVGGLNTKEQAADEGMRSYDFFGNWTFMISDITMNELRLLYGRFKEEKTEQNAEAYSINRPSGFLGGLYTAPYVYYENRFQIVDNFNIFLKNHNIKIGFDLNFITTDGDYSIYYPGVYHFDTDEPFDPVNPLTYPFLFVGAQNEQILDSFKVNNHSVFIQDSWHLHQNITLNLGLRYNYYDLDSLDFDNTTWRSFNPRFGFAWDVSGTGKTVVRFGAGTFSNSIFTFYAARVAQSNIANLKIVLMPGYPDPEFPNPFSAFLPIPTTELPPLEYVAQENQIPPYTLQLTAGVKHQVFNDASVSADLVWSRGYHLLRDNNLNPGIPGGHGYLRPDLTKGDVFVYEDSGKSEYKALQIGFLKKYSSGWAAKIAYTLSKSMTNVASDWLGTEEQMSWNNPDKDWGPQRYDARHRLNLIGMFHLPLGLRVSSIIQYHSGYPYNITLGYDANEDGQLLDYPDGVNRFSGLGQDYFSIDARIIKDFRVKSIHIQLFVDIFNLTNRTNFVAYTYIGNLQSENFGEPTQAWDPRLIQLGVRIDF